MSSKVCIHGHLALPWKQLPDFKQAKALQELTLREPNVYIVADDLASPEALLQMLQLARARDRTLFIVLWHHAAVSDPFLRVAASAAGANMVTCFIDHLVEVLEQVASQKLGSGHITCDYCGLKGLTANDYHLHLPLYHEDEPNIPALCQVCDRHVDNIARHYHHHHLPPGMSEPQRTGVERRDCNVLSHAGVFALVVVRRPSDGKFLLTQEFARSGFWLPGGGVDPGETLSQAAIRECIEEAGVKVDVKGILTLEAAHGGTWRRVIFYGEPEDEATATPKTQPNFESAGACWVDGAHIQHLPLRSASELQWALHVHSGGEIKPLQLPTKWQKVFGDFKL